MVNAVSVEDLETLAPSEHFESSDAGAVKVIPHAYEAL
jgi:hypothetical protein